MTTLGLLPEPAGYVAGLSVLAAIATLTVVLRFWATRITRAGLHPDDWLSLITIITAHALTASIFVAFTIYGLGHPTAEVLAADPWILTGLLKISYAASPVYTLASFTVKLAVIGFYFRIFPTRTTRWACGILALVCFTWFLLAVVIAFIACRPASQDWEPTINHCVDSTKYPIPLAAVNVIVDAATVALPIYEVFKLHLSKQKKYTVAGIFFIGAIATAASLTRLIGLVFAVNESTAVDPARLDTLLTSLVIIEVYVGLIGANIPTLGPILDKIRGKKNLTGAQYNSNSHSGMNSKSSKARSGSYSKTLDRNTSRSRLRNEDDVEGSYERLEGASIASTPAETMGDWAEPSERTGVTSSKMDDIQLHTIHIERDSN